MLAPKTEDSLQHIFSANLRTRCKARRVTQERLAEFVGVTQPSVSSWIRGESEPKLSHLVKIIEILDCTLDDLVRE